MNIYISVISKEKSDFLGLAALSKLILNRSDSSVLQYIGQHQNRSTLGVTIALTGGLRIGEICPLQWSDVDLEKRIFSVTKTMQRIQCPTETSKPS